MFHKERKYSTRLLCGAAVGALAMFSSMAQAQELAPIEIAPQPLAKALGEFAAQTKRAVLVTPDLTVSRVSRGVSGETDPETALMAMLDGTGLTFRQDGDTFLIVKVAADPQSGSAAGDGADGTVEALIVTAQKREEDIQDVPIAISAFTQEQLTDRQVAGGPDLMTQVPNFTFTKTNFSSYSIQIRGIGTQAISATTDPAVAIAFNNTPFIRNRFFEQEFYDLQRVEVLRGPQGTLYGRNATAGVVNIISAKPSFGYEAKLSADVANYNSTRLEGMINLPLVEDKVAMRLAGAWTKREGFVTNEITGNPIDGRDLWSTRLSLRFSPTDRIDANLIWEHFEEDDDRLRSGKQLCNTHVVTEVAGFTEVGGIPLANNPGLLNIGQGSGGWNGVQGTFSQGCTPTSLYAPESFQTPNGISLPYYLPLGAVFLPTALTDPYVSRTQSNDLRVIESTVDPEYRAKTDVVELQVAFDLTDTLSLSSETAWASDFIFSTQDFNRFNTAPGAWATSYGGGSSNGLVERGILSPEGVFCDPQIGCSDRLVAVDLSTAKSRHFSQEFRLASNFEGPFNFSVGANFLRYDTEDKYYVFINSLSIISAISPYGHVDELPTYVGGVTDNRECLKRGFVPPDYSTGEPILQCTYIDPNPIENLNDLGHNYFLSKNPYKLISYAVFGEAYYSITDALKVTAGLRWTVDKKEAPRIPSWVLASDTVGYPVIEVQELEWREPTGRLTVDWKPDLAFTDETLLYASFAHGYKAGGANPPPYGVAIYSGGEVPANIIEQSATNPKTFDPEFINAFEVGAKNTLLEGRLTVNLAGFYYDYTGYQISQIVDRSATNLNFDAEVWGVELEADWRPLENLRLGLKLGYEDTKVADGEQAIDIMDRTAGHEGWVVVRPFPSIPSNCILPEWLFVGSNWQVYSPQLVNLGGAAGGNPAGCELAYVFGHDPVTNLPYVPNPTVGAGGGSLGIFHGVWTPYPGWNPLDESQGHNHGQGFFKDLSGNELPNAPHYTATLTGDYTVPLPSDWLMTLHTDLYYQSEAWTRIFNTEGYDKLKAYTNVNLAAIFTNEDRGWKVMAYVKNVFDRDSITGAFLNSDDTGLTTNVFLTEPRLYGLRVTKEFSGGPWWTGANPDHTGPYSLTVELSGQVQRHDAPYEGFEPSFMDAFQDELSPASAQNRDLDWGDGREARLTWRPDGSLWSVAGGVRYGRTNSDTTRLHSEVEGETGCAVGGKYAAFCDPDFYGGLYYDYMMQTAMNWSDVEVSNREEHFLVDFEVGRDLGLGITRSSIGAGLRFAQLESTTKFSMDGVPDWDFPVEGWFKYDTTHHRYEAELEATREFEGVGPVLSWDAAQRLFGDDEIGHVDLDWSLNGGVLFGKQKMQITGTESSAFYSGKYTSSFTTPIDPQTTPVSIERSKSVTAPMVDLSLGLAYEIQRIKIGAGYRWERYFDVLDAGADERKKFDRTIDGPYFKLAIGFGG
jgi:outer membrane receptor protein involved in Fe transport